jgi:YD repeat-containing protein
MLPTIIAHAHSVNRAVTRRQRGATRCVRRALVLREGRNQTGLGSTGNLLGRHGRVAGSDGCTTDRDGRVTTYSYNSGGQQTGETWLDRSGGTTNLITYTLDADNELTVISDNYATLTFTYSSFAATKARSHGAHRDLARQQGQGRDGWLFRSLEQAVAGRLHRAA